jgi:hypothetical protein
MGPFSFISRMDRTSTLAIERPMGSSAAFTPPPRWTRLALLMVLGYEGAGALVGGALLAAAPDGRYMEMPVGIMHGVFRDFLIPGIILFGLGILNTCSFVAVLRRQRNDWLMAGWGLGALFVWFVVEIIILRELHWLHAMWGLPVLIGWVAAIPLIAFRNDTTAMQRGLLICGMLSSLWYVAINAIVPLFYPGYSMVTLTPSELSAIGAPTRVLWVLSALPYPLLLSAFGWGLIRSTHGDRRLLAAGMMTIAYGIFNFYWPPMHMRGAGTSLTDTLHLVWAGITMLFMWTLMVMGALLLGRGFRIYTILSIGAHIVFGALTGAQAANVPINGPTPMIGIWERINIAVFMLWVIVFSLRLLRRESDLAQHPRAVIGMDDLKRAQTVGALERTTRPRS